MEIKIKGNAHELYRSSSAREGFNSDWFDKLQAVAGRVLVVETDHLFKDQFNTPPIEGVSDIGMRIMAWLVEEVIDDERIYLMRCQYCGTNSDVHKACPSCRKADYLEPLSSEASTVLDYKRRAHEERKAGGECEVNNSMSCVSITMSDGSEYFFQGEEAENLIKEYEDIEWLWACDIEDYFLSIAQGW
jgi:hypothetical protein